MPRVFFSAPAVLSATWPEQVSAAWSAMSLPWSIVSVAADKRVVIQDDAKAEIALDLGLSPRPSGEFESDSYKVVLSFLRLAQLIRLDVAFGSVNTPTDLTDLTLLRSIVALDAPMAEFEDRAFEIGLVARAFRLRHVSLGPSRIDVSI